MSLKRLCISTAAAALLAVGVAACGGGDTETVTVQAPSGGDESPASGTEQRREGQDHRERAADRSRLARRDLEEREERGRAARRRRLRAAPGGGRRLAGSAGGAGDLAEAGRARGAAPGRRGSHARRSEGRAGRHPGREHRPAVHGARRRDRHDPRRQLPDRRAGGRLHRRRAEVQGQRRGDPGSRRHLGHRGPDQGVHGRAQEEVPGRRREDRRLAAG